MNRTKVVQISSVHPTFDTRVFVKECQSLFKGGYAVDLIVQHPQDEIIDGINIVALPIVKSKSERFKIVIPKLVKKVLNYEKGTIIHFHDSELILIGLFLKLMGYKVIYDIHEHTPYDFLDKDWIPSYLRYPLSVTVRFLEFIAGIFFDGIITVVPPVTKRFKHSNVVEISNYPKLDNIYSEVIYENQSNKLKNTAIYIGSMTEIRGLRVMIDSINLVDTKYVPVLKLGGRIVPEELEIELKNNKNWSRLIELGWLSMEQIWSELSNATVGLVLLQPTRAHLVLESVKMFEYMAAGLPVIASNFPLYQKIIDDSNCGLSVDPTKPQEIANAIEWIFENPEEAKKMGARGQKAIQEKYNWGIEEKELLDFYSKL